MYIPHTQASSSAPHRRGLRSAAIEKASAAIYGRPIRAIGTNVVTERTCRIQLRPGTLYSTIKKLLAEGLLEEVDAPRGAETDDSRRRYYRVTWQGRIAGEAEMRRMALLVRLGRAFLS